MDNSGVINIDKSNKTIEKIYSQVLPTTMKAMVMEKPGQVLVNKTIPIPKPSPQQVLISSSIILNSLKEIKIICK